MAAAFLFASSVAAQDSHVSIGGSGGLFTQTYSAPTEPLGGTAFGGSVVFGVRLAQNWAVEVEPVFGPTYSTEYSYRPLPSLVADVVASRRDTFLCFQLRTRLGKIEPVFGAAYVHGGASRHATLQSGGTYFDDEATNHGVAAVAGIDVPVRVVPHLYVFPMFRVLVTSRSQPLGSQTSSGALAFRVGAGVQVTF